MPKLFIEYSGYLEIDLEDAVFSPKIGDGGDISGDVYAALPEEARARYCLKSLSDLIRDEDNGEVTRLDMEINAG